MTNQGHRELEALMNLLEDPDNQVFDTVSNRLIELGEDVVNPLERRWELTLKPELQGKIENVIFFNHTSVPLQKFGTLLGFHLVHKIIFGVR